MDNTATSSPHSRLAQFCWADFDADGWLDAFVVPEGGEARLLSGASDGAFEDCSALLGDLGGVRAAAFGDWNADRLLDLFVAGAPAANRLLLRNAEGRFVEQPQQWLTSELAEVNAVQSLDYDGDTRLDLLLQTSAGDLLLRNVGEHFVPVPLTALGSADDGAIGRGSAAGAAQTRESVAQSSLGQAATGTIAGQDSAAQSLSSGGGSLAPPGSGTGANLLCAPNLLDVASGACLPASRLPQMGWLCPLGPDFNVTATGNVGLGTISSGPKLDVALANNELVRFGRSGISSELQLADGRIRSASNRFQLLGLTTNGTTRPIAFGQAAGDADLWIDGSGKVGVGTATPLERLDVDGNLTLVGDAQLTGRQTADQLSASASTGPPLSVQSSVRVANLNVDSLDGQTSDAFSTFGALVNAPEIASGAVTSPKLDAGLAIVGTLTADVDTLAVDSANNRVGVGSRTPSVKLGVSTDMQVEDDLFVLDELTAEGYIWAEADQVKFWHNTQAAGIVNLGDSSDPTGNGSITLNSLFDFPEHGFLSVGVDGNAFWDAAIYVAAGTGGTISANVKNFVAENPRDPSTQIWYASLEGPEAGIYARGTALLAQGTATIELPQHFRSLASRVGMTVLTTPAAAHSQGLVVTEKSPERLVVREMFAGSGSYAFDWEVRAQRIGYEEYRVVRPVAEGMPAANLRRNEAASSER